MSLITKGPVGNPDLRRVATVDSVTVSLFVWRNANLSLLVSL